MAHFAQLEPTNIPNVYRVIGVIVVNNSECIDENGQESENKGIEFCQNLTGHQYWKQTSYNKKFRHNFAGIGMIYDENHDVFFTPPHFTEEFVYKGWYFDFTHWEWMPPVQIIDPPHGTVSMWDNATESWVFVEDPTNPENQDYW